MAALFRDAATRLWRPKQVEDEDEDEDEEDSLTPKSVHHLVQRVFDDAFGAGGF